MTYNNYAEQVDALVSNMFQLNNIAEVDAYWDEPLRDLLVEDFESRGIDMMGYNDEAMDEINDIIDGVYQVYLVELRGNYSYEHMALGITYNVTLGAYVLPVFHYGTAWGYVSPSKLV